MSSPSAVMGRWRLVLLIAVATLAASLIALALRPASFDAQAQLIVSPLPQYDDAFLGTGLARDSGDASLTAPTLAQVIESDAAVDATAEELGGDWTPRSVRDAVTVAPTAEANLVTVTAEAPSAREALKLAETFTQSALDARWRTIRSDLGTRIRRLEAGRAEAASARPSLDRQLQTLRTVRAGGEDPTLRLATVEPAVAANSLSGPAVVLLALLGGLALGVLAAVALGPRGETTSPG